MADREHRELVRALRELPRDAVLWLRLSAVLERAGRLPQSVEAARVAAECEPADPAVHRRLEALSLGRGPWPDAAGGPGGARSSLLDGARRGRVVTDAHLPGAHGAVVVRPDGGAWVRAGARLAELGVDGAFRRFVSPWSVHVSPVVGPGGALLGACRARGVLSAPPGQGFSPGRLPERASLEEATVDGTGERLWAAWDGFLHGLPLRPGTRPVTIRLLASTEAFGAPRPAFSSRGLAFLAETDRQDGLVRAIDPAKGEVWRLKLRSSIRGAALASVGADDALVVRMGDSVQGLDPATSQVLWRKRTHIANWFRLPVDGLPAATLSSDGLALVSTTWGLVAYEVRTGVERWVRADLATTVPVAVDRGGVTHVSMPGRLVGVRRDGETVYEVSLPTSGRPPGPPSIGYRGTTFVVGVDRVLAVT